MPQYSVPFSSQYADLGHHEWRARGCGIASLKMVMDYWHLQNETNKTASLDELLQAGLALGAYREGVGWTHRGLVALAAGYGYEGFNADLAPRGPTPASPDHAWVALAAELVRGPVMASVYSHLDPNRDGGHIVVVTGFADDVVSFNDPEQLNEREGRRVLALAAFVRAFKQRYIVIRTR